MFLSPTHLVAHISTPVLFFPWLDTISLFGWRISPIMPLRGLDLVLLFGCRKLCHCVQYAIGGVCVFCPLGIQLRVELLADVCNVFYG